MEKVMKILTVFILGMSAWSCSGFPVYDYEPSTLKEALRASVAKVNSQVLSPYLFRGFRGAVKQINFVHGDDVYMTIEFSIRETTCRRDSGEDPSTCDFQQGYHVPAAVCRSSVQMSGSQAKGSWVSCRWASSSDSNSTEESFSLTDAALPFYGNRPSICILTPKAHSGHTSEQHLQL
ncbi:secreted phosphoprotein 24 [Rhynchocyon petersi]